MGTPGYMNGVPITTYSLAPRPQNYTDMGTPIPLSVVDMGTPTYIKNFVLCFYTTKPTVLAFFKINGRALQPLFVFNHKGV